MLNKEMVIDIIICILLSIVIIMEIIFGVNIVKDKWTSDTSKIINGALNYGNSIGLVDTVFNWPEAPKPEAAGDIVQIDENRFKINGATSAAMDIQPNYVYYSDLVDQSSQFLKYEEILDSNKVSAFQEALANYFSGDASAFLDLLPVNTKAEALEAYQQNFIEGAIPFLYDSVTENYFMFLDCGTSYYVLQCYEPFEVSDAKVTVRYPSVVDDPLMFHAWSTYEAGAIDNTRQQLMNGTLNSYTEANVGESYIDSVGNEYTSNSTVQPNTALYVSDADNQARALLVSYSNKEFDTEGKTADGSATIDINSAEAMRSLWMLTATQYSYTSNGITINGLTGSRSASTFEISGNATNTVASSRPWVLCIKFMGENNKLLGVRVIDNRSNPIPAEGVSYFNISLDTSDNIAFADIVGIQFAVH